MTQANLNHIKNKAIPILKEAGVTRSSLFGSYVRGDNTENSDIDMLIEFPKGKSLFDLIDLEFKLEDALGKKVDLGTYTSLHPLLRKKVKREQVQIL